MIVRAPPHKAFPAVSAYEVAGQIETAEVTFQAERTGHMQLEKGRTSLKALHRQVPKEAYVAKKEQHAAWILRRNKADRRCIHIYIY